MSWISDEYQNLDRSPRALRRFGFTVGSVILFLGSVLLWRHLSVGWLVISIGTVLLLAAAFVPTMLQWVHGPWMIVSFLLGWIVSGIVLTLVFFLVVTPLGLLQRLFGKNAIDAGFKADAPSYWRARKTAASTPEEYERQF
jgi:saxitoxin biosynthesis operon SxtJ-like protein